MDLLPLKDALIRHEPPPQGLGEKLGRWEKSRFSIYSNPIDYARKVLPAKFTKKQFMAVICVFYPALNPSSKSTPRTYAGYYLRWLLAQKQLTKQREKQQDVYQWL